MNDSDRSTLSHDTKPVCMKKWISWWKRKPLTVDHHRSIYVRRLCCFLNTTYQVRDSPVVKVSPEQICDPAFSFAVSSLFAIRGVQHRICGHLTLHQPEAAPVVCVTGRQGAEAALANCAHCGVSIQSLMLMSQLQLIFSWMSTFSYLMGHFVVYIVKICS